MSVVANLLDLLDQPILVSDRNGRILLANSLGKQRLAAHGLTFEPNLNLFSDLLQISPKVIEEQIDRGKQQIDAKFDFATGEALARIQWLPEADWLIVRIENIEKHGTMDSDGAPKHTVQELLQER